MIAFPGMLVGAAEKAGMKVPSNPESFDPEMFPHFQAFCNIQLGRSMGWTDHWTNAEVIASVPEDQIRLVTIADLINLGLTIRF